MKAKESALRAEILSDPFLIEAMAWKLPSELTRFAYGYVCKRGGGELALRVLCPYCAERLKRIVWHTHRIDVQKELLWAPRIRLHGVEYATCDDQWLRRYILLEYPAPGNLHGRRQEIELRRFRFGDETDHFSEAFESLLEAYLL